MIVKELGRNYKLTYSTRKRVGSVLMAIRVSEMRYLEMKPKRKRISTLSDDDIRLSKFEKELIQQINKFKQNKR